MSLVRRSPAELSVMRRAGQVVAEMHEAIRIAIRPGTTTAALDAIGREVLERRGARSNFLGYHGYPAVICASVNNVVIHGIPGPQVLEEGDVVSIDCGAVVDGWHGDAAFTMAVGEPSPEAQRLLDAAWASLDAAVGAMRPGGRLSDIGAAVQRVVEGAGLGVVRDYCGHGIGRAMHERPDVPNYGKPGRGPRLEPGVVLAVEPMLTAGRPDVAVLDDGWSVVTADGSLAAHVEHTIAITDDGPEVLTRL
jgi:methionyl aminopeptidase